MKVTRTGNLGEDNEAGRASHIVPLDADKDKTRNTVLITFRRASSKAFESAHTTATIGNLAGKSSQTDISYVVPAKGDDAV